VIQERTPNGVAVEFPPRNVRRRDVTPALGDRLLTARMSPEGRGLPSARDRRSDLIGTPGRFTRLFASKRTTIDCESIVCPCNSILLQSLSALSAADTIKVAHMDPLSGPFALVGESDGRLL
jgi:hypothetical protein